MNLDVIQVAEPCTVDWHTMSGDEQVRHCSLCRKNVYDLTSLTRSQAEELILAHEGNLCVRFYRRADGTVQTSDCLPIRRRLTVAANRTRRRLIAACAALFALAGLSTLAGRLTLAGAAETDSREKPIGGGLVLPPEWRSQRTMGIVAMPPTTHPSTQPAGSQHR